jgi:hypothetical protein
MADDPQTRTFPELRSEAERRVGRNLLRYQAIENTLKRLLLGSLAEGSPEDFAQRSEAWAAKVMRLNMGEVAKSVFEQVLPATPKDAREKHDPARAWVRTRFTIEPGPNEPDAFEKLAERCKVVVDQRNDLVHHFLRQWKRETEGELRVMLAALEEQHEAAQSLHEEFLALIRDHEQARSEFAAYVASPQGQLDLDFAMAQGSVVEVFANAAQQPRRKDGWEYVTTALHRLNGSGDLSPDVQRLKDRWGKDWVQNLLESAADVFELAEEPLPNGPPNSRGLSTDCEVIDRWESGCKYALAFSSAGRQLLVFELSICCYLIDLR